jgi:sulfite reductase beta subunit-like hemoprotein
MTRPIFQLSEEAKNEIARFRREIALLDKGERDMDDFKRFRLNNGIYGIRGTADEHMIRIKLPFGEMTADQLEVIVEVAEKYTPSKLSHVTTRQAIQLHNLKRPQVPELLQTIHDAGLTSREACGNTVRNITCDELAGVHPDEIFDVQPYAELLFRYFLRNPICQNLPRKFKIAFESTATSDRARIGIHDLGFRATVREVNGKKEFGFITTVGGGLGSMPFAAHLLEEFTPFDQFLATTEALIRIFDRHGNRRDKNRARIKFVVAEWGIEEFRKRFIEERKAVIGTSSGRHERFQIEWKSETAPVVKTDAFKNAVPGPDFNAWKKTNVIPQKQKGYSAVYIRCLYGDVNPAQGREIAAIAREVCGGRMRTTITQNLLLRWVPDAALALVHNRLQKISMGLDNALTVADITRCPGADTCNLAITHSKGLAINLTEDVFSNGFSHDPELSHITIKISGCINSCGQHHIADIGFFGASRNIDGKQMPHYQMMLGGRTGLKHEDIKFGTGVAFIPARRIGEAVKSLLTRYKTTKQAGELFPKWIDRVGLASLKEAMQPFTDPEPLRKDAAKMFEDLGDSVGTQFKVAVGKGECAA